MILEGLLFIKQKPTPISRMSLYKLIYQELHKSLYPYYVVFISIREQEKTELFHSKFIHLARFAGIFTILGKPASHCLL